mgnify:CR=1 FL=1
MGIEGGGGGDADFSRAGEDWSTYSSSSPSSSSSSSTMALADLDDRDGLDDLTRFARRLEVSTSSSSSFAFSSSPFAFSDRFLGTAGTGDAAAGEATFFWSSFGFADAEGDWTLDPLAAGGSRGFGVKKLRSETCRFSDGFDGPAIAGGGPQERNQESPKFGEYAGFPGGNRSGYV